jgi:hypothetical protein
MEFDQTSTPVLLGPAPCDDCRHAARCAETLEACPAFSLYAAGAREPGWRLAPRQPDVAIGSRLLGAGNY